MAFDDDHPRQVLVWAVCLGLLAALLVLGTYLVLEQQSAPQPTTALSDAQKAELRARARVPARLLLMAVGLLLAFVVLSYAFVRWSRAYRSHLTRAPRRPTPVEDIWSMHRLPDELPGTNGGLDESKPD